MARNAAYGRYSRRMAATSIVYAGAIFGAALMIGKGSAPSAVSIGLALVPGIAILTMIWAIGRLLVELDDEYLRLLEVRKFIVATSVLLALASVWGLLELFTTVPRVPVFFAFPVWCLGLGVGALYNRATLGDGGGCP